MVYTGSLIASPMFLPDFLPLVVGEVFLCWTPPLRGLIQSSRCWAQKKTPALALAPAPAPREQAPVPRPGAHQACISWPFSLLALSVASRRANLRALPPQLCLNAAAMAFYCDNKVPATACILATVPWLACEHPGGFAPGGFAPGSVAPGGFGPAASGRPRAVYGQQMPFPWMGERVRVRGRAYSQARRWWNVPKPTTIKDTEASRLYWLARKQRCAEERGERFHPYRPDLM